MSTAIGRQFTVSDGLNSYIVQATQTHRAQAYTAEPKLEWQYYVDELDLILVQDGNRYVSIDDVNRIFRATAGEKRANA